MGNRVSAKYLGCMVWMTRQSLAKDMIPMSEGRNRIASSETKGALK